jgi:hypothetical protein
LSHVDIDATLQVNGLRFLFLNYFVDELLVFAAAMSPPAVNSVAAVTPADSVAPGDPAVVPSVAGKKKIRYSLSMRAPDIVAPLSRSSRRQVVVSLGNLAIDNKAALEKTVVDLRGVALCVFLKACRRCLKFILFYSILSVFCGRRLKMTLELLPPRPGILWRLCL